MPKANNLQGDYCQTCAETLDHHMREPKDVLILDPECLKILKQTSDYDYIRNAEFKSKADKPGFVDRVREKVKAATE